jgi:hypothetical protein
MKRQSWNTALQTPGIFLKQVLLLLGGVVSFVWGDSPIAVLYPNGGERFFPGDTVTVRWSTAPGVRINSCGIDLTTDNGKTFVALTEKSIPDKLNSFSAECRIRVYNYTDPVVNDLSDSVFSISRAGPHGGSGCGAGVSTALILPLIVLWRRRLILYKKV